MLCFMLLPRQPRKKGFAHVYAAGQKQYQVPLLGKELAQA
jgi:hypothetical protein